MLGPSSAPPRRRAGGERGQRPPDLGHRRRILRRQREPRPHSLRLLHEQAHRLHPRPPVLREELVDLLERGGALERREFTG